MRQVLAAGLLSMLLVQGGGAQDDPSRKKSPLEGTEAVNSEAVAEWFKENSGGAGHGKKEEPPEPPEKKASLPRDPLPLAVPVDPVLSKAGIPPSLLEAIVQGNVEALHQVRQVAAEGVAAKAISDQVGKELSDALGRLAQEGAFARAEARMARHPIGDSSALRQLKIFTAPLSKSGNAAVPIDMARALEQDAFEGGQHAQGSLQGTDRGTNFFGGHPSPAPVQASPPPPSPRPGVSGPQKPPPGPRSPAPIARSMEDMSYQQRIARKLNHLDVPAPTLTPARKEASGFLPKGVKILIDDGVLEKVARMKGPETGLAEIAALEDRLLRAKDGGDLLRQLEAYAEETTQAFLKATRTVTPAKDLRMISLRKLSAELAAYRNRWSERPERLKQLGIRRIHGYLRDPSGDLVLVGQVGEQGDPLPVDALIVGLSSVFRDDLTPMVSLDPDPALPGGPQVVRVEGIPKDSSFARVLLDADYAMKHLVMGARDAAPLAVPGLKTLPDLLLDVKDPADQADQNRFWLFPVQPGPHEILVGPGGTSAVFDLRVQVLTEAMAVQAGALVGTGRTSSACDEVARSFTDHYPEIARERPIFETLRGLFDIVLLAKLLRKFVPDDEILASLLGMPRETVPVPEYYPGVSVTHTRGDQELILRGGCDVDVRLRDRAFLQVSEMPRFEEGLLLTAAGNPADGFAGISESAMSLLDHGRFQEARDRFSETIARSPDDAHAYGARALASFLLGRVSSAISDGAWALRLDPGNPKLQAIQAFIMVESGSPEILKLLGKGARAEAMGLYLRRAAAESEAGRDEEALALASRAIQIAPEEAAPYAMRARLDLLAGDFEAVDRDASEALRHDPDSSPTLIVRARSRFFLLRYPEAEADVTKAILRGDLPDLLALRALIRLRAGNAAGAAADLGRATVQGGGSLGVQVVANALRLYRSMGPEKLWPILEPSLRLPPRVQEIVAGALQESGGSKVPAVIASLEAALKALGDVEQKHPGKTGTVREFLEIKLAWTLADGVKSSEARAQALTRLGELALRRPTWLSPQIVRSAILFHSGDRDLAVRSLSAWDGKDVAADPLLAQFVGSLARPEQGVELLRFLNLAEMSERDYAPLLASLDRLGKLLVGTPGARAAQALQMHYEILSGGGSPKELSPKIAERLRPTWEPIRASIGDDLELVPAMLIGAYLAHSAFVESVLGNTDAVEARVAAFARLPLAKTPSPMTDKVVPILRSNLIEILMGRYMQELPKDPRLAGVAMGTKEYGPSLVSDFAGIEEAWVARARKLGDPVLVYQVREEIRRLRTRAFSEAIPRTLGQIEKLLDVVSDPKKIRDLESRRDDLKKIAVPGGGEGEAIRALQASMMGDLKKTLDLETFRTALGKMASRWPELAALYAPPEDLGRRIAESYLDPEIRK